MGAQKRAEAIKNKPIRQKGILSFLAGSESREEVDHPAEESLINSLHYTRYSDKVHASCIHLRVYMHQSTVSLKLGIRTWQKYKIKCYRESTVYITLPTARDAYVPLRNGQ